MQCALGCSNAGKTGNSVGERVWQQEEGSFDRKHPETPLIKP
jgi:hypothetical protein